MDISGTSFSFGDATARRAVDAYAATVRAQSPSAARRISPAPSSFVLDQPVTSQRDADFSPSSGGGDAILLPGLSAESARSLMDLDFEVPEQPSGPAFADRVASTYTDTAFAVQSRLGPQLIAPNGQFDIRI